MSNANGVTKIWLVSLITLQVGCTQRPETNFSESEVKTAIVEVVALDVCLDEALLANIELDYRECEREVSELSPICWFFIDQVVPNYQLTGDLIQNDEFHSIANIFTLCSQAELLMSMVRSHADPD